MMKSFEELTSDSPLMPYIREAGFAVREPWRLSERRLLDYLLIYIQEGTLKIQLNGTSHLFNRDEFCLLQPGDLHSLEGVTNTITPFIHFDLFFNPARVDSFPSPAGLIDLSPFYHLLQPKLNDLKAIYVPVKFSPTLPDVFKKTMLKIIGMWSDGGTLQCLEANLDLANLMLSLLKEQKEFTSHKSDPSQSLNWITSYFFFNLSHPLSIEDMAKRAKLSPSRFSTVFKQTFGMSPHQYLLNMRIQHAQTLLRTTSMGMHEISAYCGFSDMHHFAKTFRRMTDNTPNGYRRKEAAGESKESC
ncbi:helix-turn-helix domain-containing protein [Paenibacillus periandrae]|uniref:helix-turn-helix domain-containing protein n=1 Tax=Paenibacillus periandrae TaxID=1761741 RepID=UPI001F08ABCF|nr:helix-turn-helix domain-containing protein [Paenibacillus periandrae]